METKYFQEKLLAKIESNINVLQTQDKEWVIKGFIDIYKNIYTISVDTKVISKIIEVLLFPLMQEFANENNLEMILAPEQNYYPDITFKEKDTGDLFALDLKSTYRKNDIECNGFTLGAFTGYFRNRNSNKNITFSYNSYKAHFILGVIYTRQEINILENEKYSINELDKMLSVVKDFDFIVQEKYKIASTKPGSGNTKNIGSIKNINELKCGIGPFSQLGIEIFDDYWMYYYTKDMAQDGIIPYSNLREYVNYKSKVPNDSKLNRILEEYFE